MTNPTTAELREMLAKATPGPWEVGPVDDTVVTHLGADGIRREIAAIDGDYNEPDLWPIMEANAALIVAAVNSLPSLLDTVEALERERDAMREALNDLQHAEAKYRVMHDRHGDDSRQAGRAWVLMRRAGDKARALTSTKKES